MKPKHVKRLLSSAIAEVAGTPEDYCVNPDRDFTRTRKISLQKLISGIINMECKSLPNELIDMFKGAEDMPSVSAFVQQRDKLKPEAFEAVFNKFTALLTISRNIPARLTRLYFIRSNLGLSDSRYQKILMRPL